MSIFNIPSAVRLACRGSCFPAFARAGVVFGGLAAAAFAAPALAAVGDRIPFQQFTTKVCRDAAICSANFDVVPANSRLEVNSVSCFLFTRPPRDKIPGLVILGMGVTRLEFAVLNAAGEIVMHDYGVSRLSGSNDFGAFWSVNNKTFFLVPPGGRVQAVMVYSIVKKGLQLDCKIAGEQVIVR